MFAKILALCKAVVVWIRGVLGAAKTWLTSAEAVTVTGIDRVQSVLATFEDMIAELEQAQTEITGQKQDNAAQASDLQAQIAALVAESQTLDAHLKTATTVAANIKTLLQ
jgi:septal ring factor EnvC (AmiA/AmiB activator)